MTHRAHVGTGKATVEIKPGRRPGEANCIAGSVTVYTGSPWVVHTWRMAGTAGIPSVVEMCTGREIGDYRGVMAGNAEIAAAIGCIIVECDLVDRVAAERSGVPTGVGADMTLGANEAY